MKTPLTASLATALALAAGLTSAAGPTPRTPIRPIGECLVARQVLDWGVVDDRRLVVKSLGSRYYDIQLSHSCRDLNRRPYLTFRDGLRPTPLGSARGFRPGTGSDPVTSDGRICGDLGDAVIPVSGVRNGTELPCRIGNIRRIDRATFEGVFGRDSDSANAMLDSAPTLQPVARSR
ncbi:hypothetical protein IP90_03247 [Luteimonas cucumeris]|uniref:Uncharacterized protein n=1 Tax=Luteimonas cucumeris TaxID=985012 RepID=A0A562KUH2_9GAMM|nr:hypothetical protein [Luteimonas cucumeris]TWH99068.1 hypothetical protein IP90_03247 [Luteimonas cucumeris]